MEEAVFFGHKNREIFGVLHIPDFQESKRACIVFCAPFAEEKLWSHRLFVYLARELCQVGYTILRFDYYGHGDSQGDFVDATLESRLTDINTSVSFLQKTYTVKSLGILGLRLGASLAMLSGKRNSCIDYQILLEPVVNGYKYIQRCLRSNIASQMVIHGTIKKTRKDLVNDLQAGISVNIDGYLLSDKLYQEIAHLDLLTEGPSSKKPLFLLNLKKMDSEILDSDIKKLWNSFRDSIPNKNVVTINTDSVWSEIRLYAQHNSALSISIINWLNINIRTSTP